MPRPLETDEIPGDRRGLSEGGRPTPNGPGFDGVEIHSANNYLLEQFIRDSTNKRTDRYGGSVENRLRFPLEVVAAVTDVWGGGERVGIQDLAGHDPARWRTGRFERPRHLRYVYVDKLSAAGLLYIHVIEGVTRMTRDTEDGPDYDDLRRRFKGTYIGNNKMTLDLAEKELASGHADLFAFGRPFIANPDLIERLRTGAPLADAPEKYYYGGDSTGYSDWPGLKGTGGVQGVTDTLTRCQVALSKPLTLQVSSGAPGKRLSDCIPGAHDEFVRARCTGEVGRPERPAPRRGVLEFRLDPRRSAVGRNVDAGDGARGRHRIAAHREQLRS